MKQAVGNVESDKKVYRKLQQIVAQTLGIFREENALQSGLHFLGTIETAIDAFDGTNTDLRVTCENILLNARMQIMASLIRKESRGVFFRSDYPSKNDTAWQRNIILKMDHGTLTTRITEIM